MNACTSTEVRPCYELEAAYHYGQDERYSSGHGLSVMSEDLQQLENTFEVFKRRGDPYAIAITRLDTKEVVRSHGDIVSAKRSAVMAYRRLAST